MVVGVGIKAEVFIGVHGNSTPIDRYGVLLRHDKSPPHYEVARDISGKGYLEPMSDYYLLKVEERP
ncbi:hypothetical protein ES703_51652 [subsurface metagenome]